MYKLQHLLDKTRALDDRLLMSVKPTGYADNQ